MIGMGAVPAPIPGSAVPVNDIVNFLKSTELFSEAMDSSLRSIACQLEPVTLAEGSMVFREGEEGDAAYLIVSGRLALVSESVEVVERGPGSCIGEFSLLDDEPRSASGIARTPLTLLRWSREQFQRTLAEDPVLARGILRMLTRKLRSDIDRGIDLYLERERWRQDMARSREIQAGMLPPECTRLKGLEIAGRCIPAQDVGGDFYDFIEFESGEVGVTIGDVTGHGFYSALFVAIAKSCLHTQSRFNHNPAKILAALRQSMELSLHSHLLMSCCHVLFVAGGGCLRYANAGHPPPLLYEAASGRVRRLEVLDPILGVLAVDEMEYHFLEIPWQAGDVLVLYSDGISEARSRSGDEFGADRIHALLAAHGGEDPVSLREIILDSVKNHCSCKTFRDDLTVVVVQAVAGRSP